MGPEIVCTDASHSRLCKQKPIASYLESMYICNNMKRMLIILAILLFPLIMAAQEEHVDPVFGDNIDRTADDFVTVSLLIADPGGVLYSRLGHAALMMQCPTFDLDYVYSYESEDVRHRVLAFLAGKLKMGMMAIPPQDYLSAYEAEGRGVRQYELKLPIDVKRELWRVLDEKIEQGIDLEYDYIERGCAQSTLCFIKEALGSTKIEYVRWPDHFKGASRREVTYHHMQKDRWAWVVLSLLTNGSIDDTGCSRESKVIVPADLVEVLKNASVKGRTIIDSEPEQLLPSVTALKPSRFTPVHVALIILLLTIALCLMRCKVMDYLLLAFQTIIGVVVIYLIFFSTLCCTEWNWLIVPFNPLPLLIWKWRRYWQLPYAGIIVFWCAVMTFSPHQLTDPAYILLALSVAVSYLFARFSSLPQKSTV